MTLLTEKAESEILKTDVLGRVWTPRDRREALVAEYERSAMTAAEFAKCANWGSGRELGVRQHFLAVSEGARGQPFKGKGSAI